MVAAIIHQEQIVSLKEPLFEISSNTGDRVYGTQTITEMVDPNLPHLEVHYRRDLPNGKPYKIFNQISQNSIKSSLKVLSRQLTL